MICRSGGLSNLDHSLLAQYIGALGVICDDPADFFRRDLLSEAKRRLDDGVPRSSPANAGLSLALCNNRVPLTERILFKMVISPDQCSFLCVERASLNILALSCMFREKKTYNR